jgi:uracil-DNA glycosylase
MDTAGDQTAGSGYGARVKGWRNVAQSLSELAVSGLIDPGWARVLEPVAENIAHMGEFLRAEIAAGRRYLPSGEHVLRAFSYPFEAVMALIVGQDPYPTPGHPVGLSFAVARNVRPIPRSLSNIYRELSTDLGCEPPVHGDVTSWAEHGVMLLNRVLTVRPGNPGSHRGVGWEAVTDHAIRALVERSQPLVAILWGRDAGTLRPLLGDTPVIASAHPSPLSADRGFFGSRPFSRTNELLASQGLSAVQGAGPIDWGVR